MITNIGIRETVVFMIKNAIKCLKCGDELESKTRHDFRGCSCDNGAFVDGGKDYQRVGAKDLSKIAVWNNEQQKFIPAFSSLKEQIMESNDE